MEEILDSAELRIRSHRTDEVTLHLATPDGQPLPRTEVRVELTRHAFKLGANGFQIRSIADPDLQQRYEERFAALLNYATLPFYWGSYESAPGRTDVERLERMADWCAQHGIQTKGHTLVWHEVFPEWAGALDDETVLSRLRARIQAIVAHFKERIAIWDVVNEATVSSTASNAVGRWMAQNGPAACTAEALNWARTANPAATLLYNDFNVSPAFEQLCADLLERGAPVDAIGIQSHMHKGAWSVARSWLVCETYARFGRPLHFTEVTILSGPLKAADDNDWFSFRPNWPSTVEGEANQLDQGSKFYTTLFSHPAVEAITWWDFCDLRAWQGAPAGLLRADMTPKPLYNWLMDAFYSRWTTRARLVTDEAGGATLRAFFGDYQAHARTSSGDVLRGRFSLQRSGPREISVTLA